MRDLCRIGHFDNFSASELKERQWLFFGLGEGACGLMACALMAGAPLSALRNRVEGNDEYFDGRGDGRG